MSKAELHMVWMGTVIKEGENRVQFRLEKFLIFVEICKTVEWFSGESGKNFSLKLDQTGLCKVLESTLRTILHWKDGEDDLIDTPLVLFFFLHYG